MLAAGAEHAIAELTATASPSTPTAAQRADQPTARAGLPWLRAQANSIKVFSRKVVVARVGWNKVECGSVEYNLSTEN